MKKFLSLILTIAMLVAFVPQRIEVYAADQYQEAAENLFQYLSPTDTRTREIYTAYKTKNYKQAVDLYRNYFVDKLRTIDAGQFGWHDSNIAGTYVGMADIICGKITVEQFAEKYDNRKHYDYLEWWGDPSEGKPVNWLGGIGEEQIAQSNGNGFEVNLRELNRLAGAYWTNDFDTIYLDKYMQILDDFCVNQKKVADEYMEEHGLMEQDVRFWRRGGKWAQSYLWLFERINNVLRSLAVYAKYLPTVEEVEKPEWANIGEPVTTTLKPESYAKIDSLQIAHIAYSMITDHLDFAADVLADGFLITNQHNEGVIAVARLMDMFDEFTICDQYDDKLAYALKQLTVSSLPDGSFTERSFNYNVGTAAGFSELIDWLSHNDEIPGWAEAFKTASENWDRMYAAFSTSNGHTPEIGNGGNAEYAEPIWKDDTAYQKRKEAYQDTLDRNMDFKSVYFPYGGFGVMRSGWDIKEDMTLNFYNNGKKASGHNAYVTNSVWLTAYGRPLIATGACPWYGESFAPESQKDVYEKMNAYFEEQSTYKGSTVIVNGANQSGGSGQPSDILKGDWMAGTNFDYANGKFDAGYVKNNKTSYDAEHERTFVYIKQADLYVVEDTMKNTSNSANTYSQIWRIPAYSEQYANFTGFKEEQVQSDKNENVVKTTDKTGPNVYISEFSTNELSYENYYGYQGEKFIGWRHGGTGGERIPGVDVHVSWTDEKKGDATKVISVLDPTKNSETPYASKENLSDAEKGITGFTYTTDDGVKITYLSSATAQELTYGDIKVNACRLIVTEQEGAPVNGVVYGDDSDVNGYEFTMGENGMEKINTIAVPTYFKWVTSADGKYAPKYDSMDKESVEAIVNDISNKVSNLRVLKYSDAKYLLKYNKTIAEYINSTLEFIPNMPDAATTNKYIKAIYGFVDKNKEIADYYSKGEYNSDIAEIFNSVAAKAEECASNTEDMTAAETYKSMVDYIKERVK